MLRQVLRGERKTDRKKEMESLNKTEAHRWGTLRRLPRKESTFETGQQAGGTHTKALKSRDSATFSAFGVGFDSKTHRERTVD